MVGNEELERVHVFVRKTGSNVRRPQSVPTGDYEAESVQGRRGVAKAKIIRQKRRVDTTEERRVSPPCQQNEPNL